MDESGFVSEMLQEKCWSENGKPVIIERSGQRKYRTNLFCGLNHKFEPIAPFLTEENCRASNFENWFELSFLQALPLDTVITMDNARFHRKAILFDLIKCFNEWYDTQFSLPFLPAYSPDLNPIENYFAITKGKVRHLAHEGNSVTQRLKNILRI